MNYLKTKTILLLFSLALLSISCNDSEEVMIMNLDSKTYTLFEKSDSGVSGNAKFTNRSDGSVLVELMLIGTPQNGMHPSHIHFNTAAEGGGIAIGLNPVIGATGISETVVTQLEDGTPISYSDLLDFDGYINVHLSANELATVVAQGDIGQNELTGESKSFNLGEKDVDGISGSVLFEERVNGEALATIQLQNTPAGGSHPTHIHANTAAEGGGILFTFTPVDGTTGMSATNLAMLDDGTAFGYDAIFDVDAYINVHLSVNELATIVAQGDIGQNELTGESKSFNLGEKDVDGISGSVLFEERANGEALATIQLENTPSGGSHPAHIHMNTAAEGGGILFTFTPVDGTTGMSASNLASLDDGSAFGYDAILDVDAYINVHLSVDELATIVAQGDIGQNELTGASVSYPLGEQDVAGISGTVVFEERVNGEAQATIMLTGTPDGGMHPAHIHANSAAEGGAILYTFGAVNGTTGMIRTNISMLDDNSAFGYSDIVSADAYINVHLSANELSTLVAQGNIGANAM